MSRERRIDYVEFASSDPAASRAFFEKVFGWSFVDYGSDYTAFDDGRLQGGFFRGQPQRASDSGAPASLARSGWPRKKPPCRRPSSNAV